MVGGVEGDFSVMLWSKTSVQALDLDLDQAEQKEKNPRINITFSSGKTPPEHINYAAQPVLQDHTPYQFRGLVYLVSNPLYKVP